MGNGTEKTDLRLNYQMEPKNKWETAPGSMDLVENADGTKAWYINGKQHREDGPAIEYANGSKEWWLNGVEVTAETIGFIIKRKRKLALKYWLLWTDYLMNPNYGKRTKIRKSPV